MEIAIEVKLNASIPFLVQASAILATVVHPNCIEHLGSSYTAYLQLQVIGGWPDDLEQQIATNGKRKIALIFIFYHCGSQFKHDVYIIELVLFFHFM